jgi:hypothetical protein
MRHRRWQTCDAPGPHRPCGDGWEKQVFCNRWKSHELPHRLYDEHTFAVLAEWARAHQVAEHLRRKIRAS